LAEAEILQSSTHLHFDHFNLDPLAGQLSIAPTVASAPKSTAMASAKQKKCIFLQIEFK
jgi:hypothetical protein